MRAIAIVLLASLLAACSAGNTLAPSVPSVGASGAHRNGARVKMRIVIRAVPRSGRFAHRLLRGGRRNPFYTAIMTQGIDVTVAQAGSGVLGETQTTISEGSKNCTPDSTTDASRTCTFLVPVPPGSDVFTITTYDAPPVNGNSGGFGSANKLGYSVIPRVITAGTVNTFPSIALGGIVASLSLNVPIQQIHGTLASVQALGLYALDADDNVIQGSSQYYDSGGSPISISLTLGTPIGPSGKGKFTLSAPSFPTPPTSVVQLAYDGNATILSGKNSGAFSTTIVASTTGGTVAIAPVTQTVSLVGPTIKGFSVPGKQPEEIALGPDGNMWFTDFTGNAVDSIAPDGTITAHKIPTANSGPFGITLGSDGNMWFTEQSLGNIGWVTPGAAGPAHECPSTRANPSPLSGTSPAEIASGLVPGNLYVVESVGAAVAQLTTGCVVVGTYPVANAAAAPNPLGLAVASNGNIWYTESAASRVASMKAGGAHLLSVAVPKTQTLCAGSTLDSVDQIATDPAGNAWFTESCSSVVGRVTPAGAIATFKLGGDMGAHGIVYGPDGNMWLAGYDAIANVTATGVVHRYGSGKTTSEAFGIAVGSDANLWFTDRTGNIGRFAW